MVGGFELGLTCILCVLVVFVTSKELVIQVRLQRM